LTDALLKDFDRQIQSITLVPSSGGVFEVEVNDALIFSKKAAGRHAATGEIVSLVRGLAGAAAPE
jgi:selenoprotein W-related protein